ncbi:RNA 2',3'-cyclic phosphodiesterase [Halorhodospira halophila]|uniref:RNA 2',3'-cyclic phosphodiesterase n=1 Tax=Halorhodospira halophila (strain DSM 244 / SL1) TaxID=349124 RepID=A1WW74_HALHL|nr:RNA 2',3'-cyclic phosphodiesterase [Halorhodospira halophila]ABM61936.1 2'-5' RNA ligase [Halorhodospira halophila SL1]
MTERQRLFFALWPPAHLRERLTAVQGELGRIGRPVAAERLHLTVAFLGNSDPERATEAAAAATREARGFVLRLDRFGHFVRSGVVWMAPTEYPNALETLHRRLRRELRRRGLRTERRSLHPHVTLFRKATPSGPHPAASLEWPVDELTLVASVTRAEGPEYHRAGAWRLPLGEG